MFALLKSCLTWWQPTLFQPLPPLILLNGLAEQASSWFCNRSFWSKHFDVKVPELLIYEGEVLHRRIAEGAPITVDYFTDQLELYLNTFVQTPPYHLVASSLGGQIALNYAARHPDRVGRLVLLCPSGLGAEERLPIVEGVRSSDHAAMLTSIFYNPRAANPGLLRHYQKMFGNKQWKKGILRTVRGTSSHRVRELLPKVTTPTLILCGQEDRIVNTAEILDAVKGLANFRTLVLPRCGHAPQIERPRLVNRLVRDFCLEEQPVPVPSGPTKFHAPPALVPAVS
jgi:pimeloyl-ACP methyl ester carboxylesterase